CSRKAGLTSDSTVALQAPCPNMPPRAFVRGAVAPLFSGGGEPAIRRTGVSLDQDPDEGHASPRSPGISVGLRESSSGRFSFFSLATALVSVSLGTVVLVAWAL